MRVLLGTVAFVLLATCAWLWTRSETAGRGVSRIPVEEVAETRLPATLVADALPPEEPDSPTDSPLVELESDVPERVVAEGSAPEAEPVPEPDQVHVFGQVSDEYGRLVQGTRVEMILGEPASQPARGRRPMTSFGRLTLVFAEAVTDDVGAFDLGRFERSLLEDCVLAYGHDRYRGTPPSQAVVVDDVEQLLRFPDRPASGLEIALESTLAGVVPYPEWSSFDLVAQAPDVTCAAQNPHPRDVFATPGRLTVRGLAPGTWSVWVRCQGYPPRSLQVRVAEGPELTQKVLRFQEPPEPVGYLAEHRPTFEDEVSRRDPTFGFDELVIKGQSERKFGERANDKWFAHTIEGFGQGRARAAYLEIELEAQSGMAHNDTLHLEFRGWDASAGRWTGHNRYSNGQWRTTVADYVDGEMIVQIVDARDQNGPFINRETYFDIGPDRFSMKSERSYDGGRTFVKGAYSMVCNRR